VRPYLKKNPSEKRAGGVTQGVGPKFKSQYCKKKKYPEILVIQETETRRIMV
jgi:hypothetical protein